MVGQRTLNPLIQVRILAWEPLFWPLPSHNMVSVSTMRATACSMAVYLEAWTGGGRRMVAMLLEA